MLPTSLCMELGRSPVRLALMQRPHWLPSSGGLESDSFRTGGSGLENEQPADADLARVSPHRPPKTIQCPVRTPTPFAILRLLLFQSCRVTPAAPSSIAQGGVFRVGRSLSARPVL